MRIKIFQVDAFTKKLFGGNPAAVCPLNQWLPDSLMQEIAAENNLAETAFFIPKENHYHLRWFTPKAEVDLCGHATLATAHVLFHHLNYPEQSITFDSRSGLLHVKKENDLLTLDFPADSFQKTELPDFLKKAFPVAPVECYRGKMDYMLVFSSQEQIESMHPNMDLIAKADSRGVIITASGKETDFVSRYFAPQFGIPEDPVTGSAHTLLTPYWASKMNKNDFTAIQLSPRKGYLTCKLNLDRVEITGQAKTYLSGELLLP